jgi:hypothetical protein
MQTVGLVAIIVVGIIVVSALIFFLLSIPDMRRYLKMRSM